jgi:hypothetical protein
MRGLLVTILLAAPALAYADGNVEIAGGISIPAGDNNWKNIAGTSPKLGLRLGDMVGDFGGMLQVDWTPVSLNNSGGSFGFGSADASAHVFRVLAAFAVQHHLLEHFLVSGRAGIGIDIAHASGTLTLGNATLGSRSDTDVGLAVEFGGGVAYDFGGTEVGAELAVPIGDHSSASQNMSIPFQYALEDVDLLAVVRFRSSRY